MIYRYQIDIFIFTSRTPSSITRLPVEVIGGGGGVRKEKAESGVQEI